MKKTSLLSIFILLIIISCTVLPWVKDINNIFDWVVMPKENTEYRFLNRVKYYEGDWSTYYVTYTVIDIDEYGDTKVITFREDADDLDYVVIDKDEGGIAWSAKDAYYDKYTDFIILRTPVEKGTKWYTDDYNFEIDNINQSITVEAGTFDDCIVIKYSGNNIISGELYYSISTSMWVYIHEIYSYGEFISELDNIRE